MLNSSEPTFDFLEQVRAVLVTIFVGNADAPFSVIRYKLILAFARKDKATELVWIDAATYYK